MNRLLLALLWALFHSLDYYLTLWAAWWYQKGVKERLNFSGGYELTPEFSGNILRLQWFSPQMLLSLGAGFLILWGLPLLLAGSPSPLPFSGRVFAAGEGRFADPPFGQFDFVLPDPPLPGSG